MRLSKLQITIYEDDVVVSDEHSSILIEEFYIYKSDGGLKFTGNCRGCLGKMIWYWEDGQLYDCDHHSRADVDWDLCYACAIEQAGLEYRGEDYGRVDGTNPVYKLLMDGTYVLRDDVIAEINIGDAMGMFKYVLREEILAQLHFNDPVFDGDEDMEGSV